MRYRDIIQFGDLVLLPEGIKAVVTRWDIIAGGHVMMAVVRPVDINIFKRFFRFIFCQNYFYDRQIDLLKRLG